MVAKWQILDMILANVLQTDLDQEAKKKKKKKSFLTHLPTWKILCMVTHPTDLRSIPSAAANSLLPHGHSCMWVLSQTWTWTDSLPGWGAVKLAGGQCSKEAQSGAGFRTSACVEDCERVWQVGHNGMRSWTPAGLSHVPPPASLSGRKIWACELRGGGGVVGLGVVRMTMERLLTVGHTSQRGQSNTNPWKQTSTLLTDITLTSSLQNYSLISLTTETFGSSLELILLSFVQRSFNQKQIF